MPLPAEALTIEGGCNCRAICFRIDIPAIEQRPLHFARGSEGPHEKVHLPMVVSDHCNDCRRATGSILPFWICTPISMVSTSWIPRSNQNVSETAERGRQWFPATEIFNPSARSENTFLTFFESSEGRRRSFCGRCGTNLSYAIFPTPEEWPEMLDIALGTIDRKFLELQALAPERQLWWDCGIDWIKQLSVGGAGNLTRHLSYDVGDIVQ